MPTVEVIADKLTMSAFEIESIEGDDVIDVKILPDRAHYALSHYGVASDIAVVFGYKLKPKNEIKLPEISKDLKVEIEDNGIGMSQEDVLLAFSQHTTSKLTHIFDLFQLNSFKNEFKRQRSYRKIILFYQRGVGNV